MVTKQNPGEVKNQQTNIEDLPTNPEQDAEVKGGGREEWIEVQSFQFGVGRGIGSPTT